jgi:MoaA/NifB/PqqE/SkfB family radical SAM enzyme
MHWHDHGVSRFALYDDNFLFRSDTFSKPMLSGIGRLPFEPAFYNPNALNASLIDRETAALLKEAGFREVRIGLETADPATMTATGGKVDRDAFERAVDVLRHAGFAGSSLKAYVLAGLPLQRWEEVERTVDYAADLGVHVSLAEYTPIPHTAMVEENLSLARYPIGDEPLFQNNALFPFAWEGFTEEDMNGLKAYVRKRNQRLHPAL